MLQQRFRGVRPISLIEAKESFQDVSPQYHKTFTLTPCLHDLRTPLIANAASGSVAGVKALLDTGAAVDDIDADGNTALHVATQQGHVQIVQLIAAKCADVDCVNVLQQSPLQIAAEQGHVECARALIKHGAKPSRCTNGSSPLHCAAMHGHATVLHELLKCTSSEVDVRGHYNRTPLLISAAYGHIDCVATLITHHADVTLRDVYQHSPLSSAILRNHTHVLQYLARTLPPHQPSTTRVLQDALSTAAAIGHIGCVRVCVHYGADVGTANSASPPTNGAIHVSAISGHLEVASFLIAQGCDVNVRGSQKRTPLMCAASAGHVACVAHFLARGARAHVSDDWGNTALHYAARRGHADVLSVMLTVCDTDTRYGVSDRSVVVDKQGFEGNTPLMVCSSVDCADVLLRYGADGRLVNGQRQSVAHCLALRQKYDVLRLVMRKCEVDVDQPDCFGHSTFMALFK